MSSSSSISSLLPRELIEKEFHKNIESTSCCRPDFKEILSECEKLALEKPEVREKMENLKTWLLRLKSLDKQNSRLVSSQNKQ